MLGIPLAIITANAIEWAVHKHVLHGLGRDRKSFWSFHWHEHHGASRRNGHRDPDYERSVLGWHAQGKEALGLAMLGASFLPLLPVAPGFTLTLWGCGLYYHHVHRKAHLDPEWARTHLTWHYDHHMGPNQDANWCVTWPWFDHLMGTRVPYVGTEREARDIKRRAEAAARRAERVEQEA